MINAYTFDKNDFEDLLNKAGPLEGYDPCSDLNMEIYEEKFGLWLRSHDSITFCFEFNKYKRRLDMAERGSVVCMARGCKEKWTCEQCFCCKDCCLCKFDGESTDETEAVPVIIEDDGYCD